MWNLASVSITSSCRHIRTRVRESKLNNRLYPRNEADRRQEENRLSFSCARWTYERSEGREVSSRRVGAGFSLRKKRRWRRRRRRERSREPRPRNSTRDSQRSGIMLIYRSNFDNGGISGLHRVLRRRFASKSREINIRAREKGKRETEKSRI